MLYGLLTVISLVAAIAGFFLFSRSGNTLAVVLGIIGVLATVGFGAVFLSGRVNQKEDIHITE